VRVIFGLALTVVLFFAGLFAFARFGPGIPLSVSQVTTAKNDLFTVSAEGKVTAVPDIAVVNLGFTATDQSVAVVQTRANAVVKKLSADLKALGINEKDIQTSNYNIYPNYDYRESVQKITGYSINVNMTVKVRDFAKINNVIDTAAADGANQIGGLNFSVDDPEKYRAQARKEAIAKAKLKAEETAKEAGINLGKLVNVSEGYASPPIPMYAKMEAVAGVGGGGEPTKIEPGSSEITVTVTLSYETR
jgi:uncharacterized protein YggE